MIKKHSSYENEKKNLVKDYEDGLITKEELEAAMRHLHAAYKKDKQDGKEA